MKYNSFESVIARPLAGFKTGSRVKKTVFTDSDDEILLTVREGDTDAFGKLATRYEDFVFTLVLGLVRSEEMAKDITQETFLRAYRGIRRFELRSSFKTWLYRIAHNTAMSHLNRENMNRGLTKIERMGSSIDSSRDQTLKLMLEQLLGKLKPELRSVIIFRYYDDLKYEEIAEILNCPIGTVKIRLYRAKHELKKLWARYAV